jgi:hypothetical protein
MTAVLLGYLQTALLTIVTAVVGVVATKIALKLGDLFDIKLTDRQLAQIKTVAEHGVRAAFISLRAGQGQQKQELAVRTAAKLAPKAFGSLPTDQQYAVINSTYAQLRPSLQTPSLPPGGSLSFAPGTVLQVVSEPPANIPRAPAVPSEGTTFVDDGDVATNPARPRSKVQS